MINRYALEALRIKDGRTKASLAKAAGISPQYYGDIEAGRRGKAITPGVVKALAIALDIPMSAITCAHSEQEAA